MSSAYRGEDFTEFAGVGQRVNVAGGSVEQFFESRLEHFTAEEFAEDWLKTFRSESHLETESCQLAFALMLFYNY